MESYRQHMLQPDDADGYYIVKRRTLTPRLTAGSRGSGSSSSSAATTHHCCVHERQAKHRLRRRCNWAACAHCCSGTAGRCRAGIRRAATQSRAGGGGGNVAHVRPWTRVQTRAAATGAIAALWCVSCYTWRSPACGVHVRLHASTYVSVTLQQSAPLQCDECPQLGPGRNCTAVRSDWRISRRQLAGVNRRGQERAAEPR